MRLGCRKWRFFDAMCAWGILGAFSFLVLGCSDGANTAGNSAETGSPELAGVLYLDGGKPAVLSRVQCVPSQFDVLHDALPDGFQTVTNDSGAYALEGLTAGIYSLEAFDSESGEQLLVQNIKVPDSGRVVVSDTLELPGYVLLDLQSDSLNGTKGVVYVYGTTIYRQVSVDSALVVVDSLPADSLNLVVSLNEGKDVYNVGVNILAGDTVLIRLPHNCDLLDEDGACGADSLALADTMIYRYVIPLAWPADADTSYGTYSSDIPLAIRLDSSNCNFADYVGLEGRWEVYRISAGGRSKSLPIIQSFFDVDAQKALFWVNVDSLNVADSLELIFNTSLTIRYAVDVFPTSRVYTAVYHFESGLNGLQDGDAENGFLADAAEKQNYMGTGTGLKNTSGVVGSGVLFDGRSFMTVEGSAVTDTIRKSSLNYGFADYFGFSLWVKFDDMKCTQTIFAKGESQYDLRFQPDSGFVVEMFHLAESYKDSTSDTSSYKSVVTSGKSLVLADEWNFIAYNHVNNWHSLFVNGKRITVAAENVPWAGAISSEFDFEVGRMNGATGGSQYLRGSLDELFLAGAIRSDAWNMATYLNQKGDWPKVIEK